MVGLAGPAVAVDGALGLVTDGAPNPGADARPGRTAGGSCPRAAGDQAATTAGNPGHDGWRGRDISGQFRVSFRSLLRALHTITTVVATFGHPPIEGARSTTPATLPPPPGALNRALPGAFGYGAVPTTNALQSCCYAVRAVSGGHGYPAQDDGRNSRNTHFGRRWHGPAARTNRDRSVVRRRAKRGCWGCRGAKRVRGFRDRNAESGEQAGGDAAVAAPESRFRPHRGECKMGFAPVA